jgi:hypothetical protein
MLHTTEGACVGTNVLLALVTEVHCFRETSGRPPLVRCASCASAALGAVRAGASREGPLSLRTR